MVLEHALLHVRCGEERAFEESLAKARPLISVSPGFINMEVRPALEKTGTYLLLVQWSSVDDHKVGFRTSERYLAWRELLHHFYEPMPSVMYFGEPL
ncbi:antibiotic biosynthesis monooxygenase [Sphingorhabdus sp.]|uniref:antibiotic biosynthesis monooxygenase family protein n=1 Tax=Sphingorhabdus sp. TaxID=1902408 RepID=UPI003341CC7B